MNTVFGLAVALRFASLVPVCAFTALAQTSAVTVQPIEAGTYPLEPLVLERSDTRYHFAADGKGYYTRTVSVRVQGESTLKQFGVLAVPFAGKSEKVEWVYARVKHGDGTTTETPLTGAMEIVEPVTREAPVYSDLKQMQLPVRDLRLGDTLEWKAKVVRTTAEVRPGRLFELSRGGLRVRSGALSH